MIDDEVERIGHALVVWTAIGALFYLVVAAIAGWL